MWLSHRGTLTSSWPGHRSQLCLIEQLPLSVSCTDGLPVSSFFKGTYHFFFSSILIENLFFYIQNRSTKALKIWALLPGTKPSRRVFILFCKKATLKWTLESVIVWEEHYPGRLGRPHWPAAQKTLPALVNFPWLISGTCLSSLRIRILSALQSGSNDLRRTHVNPS